jgi:hypothetical protein
VPLSSPPPRRHGRSSPTTPLCRHSPAPPSLSDARCCRRGPCVEFFRAAPWPALARAAAPSLACARRRRPTPSSSARPQYRGLSCHPSRSGSGGVSRTLPCRPNRRGPSPPHGRSLQVARSLPPPSPQQGRRW